MGLGEELFASSSESESESVENEKRADPVSSSRRIMESDDESDSEEKSNRNKPKQSSINSDSDGSDDDQENLFGDISDEEEPTNKKVTTITDDDEEQDLFGESKSSDDEDVDDHEQVQFQEIEESASLPFVGGPQPNNENLFLVKLPNFLNIEHTPFDESAHKPIAADAEDAEGQIRLQVENTIRWRYDPTDPNQKNSNARMVRWSDNSFSLLFGDELFEVPVTDISDRHQYLLINQADDGYLQTYTRFKKVISFRPHSTHSMTHKKLTMAIAHKHTKVAKTKVWTTTSDPEKMKQAAEKMEMEKQKAKRKLESKRQSVLGRTSRYDRDSYRRGDANLFESLRRYEEDDYDMDDDLGTKGFEDDFIEESGDEDDDTKASRLMEAKRGSTSEPNTPQQKKRLRVDDSDED